MSPPAVDVVTLRAQPVTLTREVPGRTRASQIAEVRPQVSGIIRGRLFEEGSMVSAGQPLYQLDDATYRADLASAQAALKRAQATLNAARLRARRSAELARIDAISTQENEDAIAAEQQAAADVASARATVQRSALNVEYARIASPIDGRIGTSAVTVGALVTANQPEPLATVQQFDPMHVDISAPVEDLTEFRHEAAASGLQSDPGGMPVAVLLADGTRYAHEGRVQATDLSVDPATGSFTLRVVVPNPDMTLLPGMYVRAVADLGVRPDSVLVPQRGITRDPKGNATALVVGTDGTVEVREVRTARAIGDQWLVESGVQAGERVIVSGLQRVQPGIKVAATEAAPGASATVPATGQPATAAPAPAQQPVDGAAPAEDDVPQDAAEAEATEPATDYADPTPDAR